MNNIQNWNILELRKTSGTEKIKCPICTDTRKNKSDKSLNIWHNNGTGKCFNDGCNALFFRDSVEKAMITENYILPKQEWRNYTELSDKLVKYCEGTRSITQLTLKHFNISEEKYYQPALEKDVINIVFNYFEGETLVNKKYRSGNKKFTQSKSGKPIFYNINAVIGEDSAYIVEGEFDVLALYQIGIFNVISIPNGANDNDNYWVNSEKYIKDIKKFYIATDNDESGNNVADKIVQRLGKYRCERILFSGKDANEDLVNGVLTDTIRLTKKYPVSGTFTSDDLIDKMIDLYDSGLPNCLEFKNPMLKPLNNIFKLMFGHLCVGTGIPSHGKSNFTEWMVLNYVLENDIKASFFSPEHQPLELHYSTFVQKVIGKNYFLDIQNESRATKEDLMTFHKWANQKIYLTSPDSGEYAHWDWLFDKFKEQILTFGINIFVVDAWNKVEHNNTKTTLENINRTLSRLTQFAQQHNVLIIVIAHPTKMKKKDDGMYEEPTLYDVSGSADFRNQTHDGFCIYRNFSEGDYTKFRNLKTKYTFQGEIGAEVEFDYHKPSGRYHLRGEQPQKFNLIDKYKNYIPCINNVTYTMQNGGEIYQSDLPF